MPVVQNESPYYLVGGKLSDHFIREELTRARMYKVNILIMLPKITPNRSKYFNPAKTNLTLYDLDVINKTVRNQTQELAKFEIDKLTLGEAKIKRVNLK